LQPTADRDNIRIMYRYHIDWCKIATTKLNDVATLGSNCVSFFYGNGLVDFKKSK
jgi:hypothetical protein